MSLNGNNRKRCIVQKLDFENCIVTNIKTTARGRKKLRARITREIEEISDTLIDKQCKKSASVSRTSQPSSPVLIKNRSKKSESPIYVKKKKINFVEENMGNLRENSTVNEFSSPPGSPVFKAFKKHKTENYYLNSSEELHKAFGSRTSLDMFNSQESASSLLPSSFQIDEFTQESKPSFKISSVESSSIKNESCNIGSFESKAGLSNVSHQYSSLEMTNRFDSQEKCESPRPVKKSYKKNSLLGRLQKLQQKQASEKLLWQHQNRKDSPGSLKVSVISFWKEEFNYFLKCQSVMTDLELTFLIVDSRWVPNVKKIKEGSVIRLHPPWQKLPVEGSIMKVLLNVICLDVLNETEEAVPPNKKCELLPVIQFESHQKLFVDSLFFSCDSGFF